jgi:hypothetical protein
MPTEELENELRRVLAREAADIPNPEQAGQRLLGHNYRPGGGHRRLAAGITAATAAAAVVLGLGLSGAFGPARADRTSTTRTMGFTLVRHANGTATLTLNWQVFLEPSDLQSDLHQDGIPAIVTSGSFCSSGSAPPGLGQVVIPHQKKPWTITIDPAAMPAGTELSFGNFEFLTGRPEPHDSPAAVAEAILEARGQLGEGQSGAMTLVTLIDTSSYTCAGTAPPWDAIVPVPRPVPSK